MSPERKGILEPMNTSQGRYKAWVMRWEWAGEHAAVDDPIIAILRPQTSVERVRRFVEFHYAATKYEPSEMLRWMRRPKENPYPATLGHTKVIEEDGSEQWIAWEGEVHCGHNPYIVARLATNVHLVQESPYSPASLRWDDVPRPVIDLTRRGPRKG